MTVNLREGSETILVRPWDAPPVTREFDTGTGSVQATPETTVNNPVQKQVVMGINSPQMSG